jgi:hypothetical protein
MDYKDLRKKFVELSGRYDLIKSTDEDDGADFFINAGQKYLDRLLTTNKMWARYPVAVAAGTYIVKTVDIRAIKEVWISNADGKIQLTPCNMQQLRTEYAEEFASVTQGQPTYYAPAIFRPAPDSLNSITGLSDSADLLLYNATAPAQHFNYHGIVIMPPPDVAYTVTIWGLFYSPTLTATLSGSTWTQVKSYWTEVHPEVLIEAALFKLEGFYRNTDGAKDFKATLMEDVSGLDNDSVEEDLVGDMQMGG